MIKLGLLDFDTSHVVEFTRRLNHVDCPEEQWIEGARVVAACPGESHIMPERIGPNTEAMKKLGVPLVDRPEDLIGKVDGMLIESQEGSKHWPRAKLFLEAGIPCFVDKPFTCGVADARRLIDLAATRKTWLFSSSSLRFEPTLASYVAGTAGVNHGSVLGAFAFGPGSEHPRNPGLFHYGIHAVEILYTLMGSGCDQVVCRHERDADVITGHWNNGRLGTVRTTRAGAASYGVVVFAEKSTTPLVLSTSNIYRELLRAIVVFFETGKSPVPPEVSLEIVAFIEAANASRNNHGSWIKLELA